MKERRKSVLTDAYKINMTIAPHIASAIKKGARKAGMTLTSYVRILLAEALKNA